MTRAAVGGPRRGFGLVLSTLVALHACMASTRIAASLAVLQQGYPAWTVGALLSLYAFAPIVLSLWAGRLADRFGFHRPVAWSVSMAFAGAALPVVTPHAAVLAVSALLTGGGLSIAAVTIQREAGRLARDTVELRRVFSWVALGPALSNTAAPVLSGLLIDHLGFRAAFAFGAVLPLLGAWAAWQVPRVASAAPHPSGAALPGGGAFGLLRDPALRSLMWVNVAMAAAWDSHSFAVPVIGHARDLSASAIGLVLSSFALASTAVRVVILTWGQHIAEQRALRVAITLATGALLVYAWLPGTPGMLLGSAVLGIALGSVQPMVLTMLHQAVPPERQGQALALRMLFTNAATITMPLLFGLLATATTAAAPMWLMALLLVAARWPARRLGVAASGKLEADSGRV